MTEGIDKCSTNCTTSKENCNICVEKVLEDNSTPSLCKICLEEFVVQIARNCDKDCLKNIGLDPDNIDPDICRKCGKKSKNLLKICFNYDVQ